MNDLKNLYIDSRYETIYDLLRRIIYLFGLDSVLVALSEIYQEEDNEKHPFVTLGTPNENNPFIIFRKFYDNRCKCSPSIPVSTGGICTFCNLLR